MFARQHVIIRRSSVEINKTTITDAPAYVILAIQVTFSPKQSKKSSLLQFIEQLIDKLLFTDKLFADPLAIIFSIF